MFYWWKTNFISALQQVSFVAKGRRSSRLEQATTQPYYCRTRMVSIVSLVELWEEHLACLGQHEVHGVTTLLCSSVAT